MMHESTNSIMLILCTTTVVIFFSAGLRIMCKLCHVYVFRGFFYIASNIALTDRLENFVLLHSVHSCVAYFILSHSPGKMCGLQKLKPMAVCVEY